MRPVVRRLAWPAETVYNVIADYQEHAHILPRPPFEELVIEAGGRGAGTRIQAIMKVMGRRVRIPMVVSEPAPGTLVETADDGTVTTFTVTPDAQGCIVAIETRWPSRTTKERVQGWINAWFARGFYRRELAQLEAYLEKGKRPA